MSSERHHPAATGYADREPTKPPNWHGLVAADMFLNALSTGLFLTAALAELAAPAVFGPTARWAYPVAVALLLADHTCLILDLGDPLRFHHMLRVFKPLSPMSLGTWCLAAYSLPLSAAGALDVLALTGLLSEGPALRGTRMAVVALGVPFAFGTAAYKGVLFSTTAQPGWRDARWLGAYHITSALALGAVTLLALSLLAGQEQAAAALRPAAGLLLGLSLVPLALVTAEMRAALARRHSRGQLAAAGALVYGGGVLGPVVALAVGGTALLLGGAALALVGGAVARYIIVMLPQPGPGRTAARRDLAAPPVARKTPKLTPELMRDARRTRRR